MGFYFPSRDWWIIMLWRIVLIKKGDATFVMRFCIWLGEWGYCLGRDRRGCWIGPGCTTWHKTKRWRTPLLRPTNNKSGNPDHLQSWQHLARCASPTNDADWYRTHLVRQAAREHHMPTVQSATRPPFSRRDVAYGRWRPAHTRDTPLPGGSLSPTLRSLTPLPPNGHYPASFPGNKKSRRCTDPRGPHGLVKYRETNRLYISVSQRRRSI